MISDDRLSKALQYLATSDEDCAQLRADMARAEHKAKAIHAAIMNAQDKGSVEDRKAVATNSDDYMKAMDDYFDLFVRYEAMRNKRATESILIEVWRSLNASRRAGNI